MPFQKLHLIVNPAAGRNEAILNTVNDVFHAVDLRWDVSVTLQDGDGAQAARTALDDGADLIVVYGGDGTVKDVASGMVEADVPLAILPGGTGNALIYKLGLPDSLKAACQLITQPHDFRPLDLGHVRCEKSAAEGYFLLRANVGLSNAIVEKASRDLKDRFGNLAYLFSAIQSLNQADEIEFQVTADQDSLRLTGVACMVANAVTIGGGAAFDFAPEVLVDDQTLDLFIFEHQSTAILEILKSQLSADLSQFKGHYPGRHFHIATAAPQNITLDGEVLGETPPPLRSS
ncbi:MAG: hypothetical protein HC915_21000, partial [Anaerolineae bacterium]|nr:hypothetical protein [Anaerolineae bacterium]